MQSLRHQPKAPILEDDGKLLMCRIENGVRKMRQVVCAAHRLQFVLNPERSMEVVMLFAMRIETRISRNS